jgi:hypothetical protein
MARGRGISGGTDVQVESISRPVSSLQLEIPFVVAGLAQKLMK